VLDCGSRHKKKKYDKDTAHNLFFGSRLVTRASPRRLAHYIRYTPNPNAPGVVAGAKQRIIKMVEEMVDPLGKEKHKSFKPTLFSLL
jgi:hypothetical protein